MVGFASINLLWISLMASLYKIYFDESGTHADSEIAVVAGFVSNVTEWTKFSERWQSTLGEFGIEYFHMSEFENRQGRFANLGNETRKDLLQKLMEITQDHTFWSVSCTVIKQDVSKLLNKATRHVLGDVYGLAAMSCWSHLGAVLKENDAYMDCSMESGAYGSGMLKEIFDDESDNPEWHEENRIVSLSFQDKRDFPPLQASDILAYEVYKQSLRQFGDETRPPRFPMTEYLMKQKHQWVYMQQSDLIELNEHIARLGES